MENCSKYEKTSGEHLTCELQNELIQLEKDLSYRQGAITGVFMTLLLVGLICAIRWIDQKEKKL